MGWNTDHVAKTSLTPAYGKETRDAIVIHDGIILTTALGVTVTFTEAFSAITDYAVSFDWQEDPGPNSGFPYPVKSLGSCLIKVTGTEYGKLLYYRVKAVKSL
jgi:hypothetical protein